eukprot:Gb_23157 [translate_table: standard]
MMQCLGVLQCKPYLHESRHLHALRRARGCGGRFLNTKKDGSHQDMVSRDKDFNECIGQDPKVDNTASRKDESSEGSNRIQETGNVAHMGNNTGTVHSGTVPPAGQVGVSASMSNGMYYNYLQRGFHSSAFHPLSAGNAESNQVGGMVSNGGHHTAVATQ